MREILFRGQTRRTGELVQINGKPVKGNWVYGGIFPGSGDYSIIYQQEPDIDKFTVYTDTVGQYTGLTDKNGTKIFEGDIVITSKGRKCLVKWFDSPSYCGWDLKAVETMNPPPSKWDLYAEGNLEVIGNIYDNKELLEE